MFDLCEFEGRNEVSIVHCGDSHIVDKEVTTGIIDEVALVMLMVGVAARVVITFAH